MMNSGVSCNVTQCEHYASGDRCQLDKIHVTNQTTGQKAMETPHFCKNFKECCK